MDLFDERESKDCDDDEGTVGGKGTMQKSCKGGDAGAHGRELSAARQALEGAAVAPGTRATLNALKDPSRRPADPRDPLPDELTSFVPESRFVFDQDHVLPESEVITSRSGGRAFRHDNKAPSMPLG